MVSLIPPYSSRATGNFDSLFAMLGDEVFGLGPYSSYASNLVEGDTNNVTDMFVAQIYDYWWM